MEPYWELGSTSLGRMLYRAADQAHASPCHQVHGKERLQARRGEDLGINLSFHRCMERMIDHKTHQGRRLDPAFSFFLLVIADVGKIRMN